MKSIVSAVPPPTVVAGCAAAASRTASTALRPACELVSLRGRTSTTASPSARHPPRAARCAGGADAVDRRHAGGGGVRAGGRGQDFDGREQRGADAGAIELLERGLRVAGAAE